MLEDFKQHPTIRPLIAGQLLEYSAHMVPEGGLAMVPKLVDDGVMIVGDAAGFCLNLGFTVRGMDLAIASANHCPNSFCSKRTPGFLCQQPDGLQARARTGLCDA